jgi:dephospho-CoA kinase
VIIGLTGGMACGKSSAAEAFRAEGFGSIDTDELVREILRDDPRVKEALSARYGAAVMTPNGEVDRKALAKIVFASPADLAWLESLLHPEVDLLWRERVATEPERNWVVQVPLLFEAGMEGGFQATVCVAASPGVRRERVRARGMTDIEADSRDARQLPLEKKMDLADYVIINDGSRRFLHEQVRELVGIFKIRQP